MYWNPRSESIQSLQRIYRECSNIVSDYTKRYNTLKEEPYDSEKALLIENKLINMKSVIERNRAKAFQARLELTRR
jgi:hypothetical protein